MILAVDGLPIRRGNFGNIFASIEPAWGWISFEWNISILFIVLELNFDTFNWDSSPEPSYAKPILTFFISLFELNFG